MLWNHVLGIDPTRNHGKIFLVILSLIDVFLRQIISKLNLEVIESLKFLLLSDLFPFFSFSDQTGSQLLGESNLVQSEFSQPDPGGDGFHYDVQRNYY
jgi:hypothetical protein